MVKRSISDISVEGVSTEQSVNTPNHEANWLSLEDLQKFKLFLATPCYGGQVTDQYQLSIFRLSQALAQLKIDFSITTLRNESLIPRGRNILAAMYLESKSTHLMFIDADIEFEPESVIRMLRMNKDLVAGAYPKKTLPIQYAINLKILDPVTGKVNIQDGAVELLDASTGFFLVKRRVFDKLIALHPELHFKNDSSIDPKFNPYCYALFDTWIDSKDHRYLSEDYYFCRLWQQAGGQIWLDPQTKLNHIGSYTFEGDVSQLFSRTGFNR